MQPLPKLYVIQGVTKAGRTFRPSDWAERLCGVLGSFDEDERLRYADEVQPTLIEGMRCILVSARLPSLNPIGFKFLLDFARDNDLRVLEPAESIAAVAASAPVERLVATA